MEKKGETMKGILEAVFLNAILFFFYYIFDALETEISIPVLFLLYIPIIFFSIKLIRKIFRYYG